MLKPEDRQAIDYLFERIADVEAKGPPRDGEAERYIAEKLGADPAAPYYMAQTILVQEQALNLAEQQIEDLKAQLEAREGRDGGFLGGLFGDNQRSRSPAPQRRQEPLDDVQRNRGGGAWGGGPWGGGGFLAGAAQTAMGVAGGVLLGNAIASMFGAGEANAAETDYGTDAPAEEPAADAGADDFGGGDDFGGDFDMGGDF